MSLAATIINIYKNEEANKVFFFFFNVNNGDGKFRQKCKFCSKPHSPHMLPTWPATLHNHYSREMGGREAQVFLVVFGAFSKTFLVMEGS